MNNEQYDKIMKKLNTIETELFNVKEEQEHHSQVLRALHTMILDIFKRLGKFEKALIKFI